MEAEGGGGGGVVKEFAGAATDECKAAILKSSTFDFLNYFLNAFTNRDSDSFPGLNF